MRKICGVAIARQGGILLSQGTYIGFIDPDDWIEKDMFGKMVNCAESNNCRYCDL
ncbi:glycosyltransferase [Phascolarctobacterium faecium]|uniref:glycosyltransferase n=1 Tax=Phascolarctobacterium faecium TaxID=33025 RepID=UPI00338E8BEB